MNASINKHIEVEKRILQYWTDVLTRPDWKEFPKQKNNVLSKCQTLQELLELRLDRTTITHGTTGDEPIFIHIVAAHCVREKCQTPYVILAEIDNNGNIVPVREEESILLNPNYFAHDESLLTEDTLGLAKTFYEACRDISTTSWASYIEGLKQAFTSNKVDIESPPLYHGQPQKIQWWIVPRVSEFDISVHQIVRRYQRLLQTPVNQWPTVFRRLLQQSSETDTSVEMPSILAHVDATTNKDDREVWPFDATQRFATASGLSLSEGQALTVHGPPGTGKTTFLRSLIASMWVNPLLNEDIHLANPPIIVAAAPTNSSSENMIGAFDKTVPQNVTDDRMDCRFIPGNQTYGWYFPAKYRREKMTRPSLIYSYKTKRLTYEQVENRLNQLTSSEETGNKANILQELEFAYVANSSRVLNQSFMTLRESMDALALELNRLYERVTQHEERTQEWLSLRPSEASNSKLDKSEALTESRTKRPEWLTFLLRLLRQIFGLSWRTNPDNLSQLDTPQLHPRVEDFLRRALPSDLPEWWARIYDKQKIYDVYQQIYDCATRPSADWEEAAKKLWTEYAEVAYKPAIFHVGARIWEGRWIEEMKKGVESLSLDKQLRTASMIAPFIVATIHRLPYIANQLQIKERAFADLVIVDEAGQASIEQAAASLSCGKRASAVGDLKQLPPVQKVEEPEDKILRRLYQIEDVNKSLSISKGQVLEALSGCSIHSRADGMSGVQLLYHYRCLEPIIQFSNHLSYDGKLIARRPVSKKDLPWPPMSFVLTDTSYLERAAEAENESGWKNCDQAREIALWMAEERESLERAYKEPIEKIVAVITPFKPQEKVLKEEFQRVFGEEIVNSGGMIIGTVNALQGMERRVVIFSSVVTGSKRSKWLAGNPNLLNVAVSRAQDSFIVFGDRDVLFETPARTPLAKLGKYMDLYGEMLYPKDIVVVEAPGKKNKFQNALGRRHLVVATGGHFRKIPVMNAEIDWRTPPWRVKNDESAHTFGKILKYVRGLKHIVLATDDDREGEAIAWHVLDELFRRGIPIKSEQVKRMRFSSLVPETLRHSYATAGLGLDMNRVRAALTREIADYVIGQKYSKKLNVGVGRVSGALLLASAERLRGEPRYRVTVDIQTEDAKSFKGYVVDHGTSVSKPLEGSKKELQPIFSALTALNLNSVSDGNVEDKGSRRILRIGLKLETPTTMDLLMFLTQNGFTPWDAAKALQELYEGGVR